MRGAGELGGSVWPHLADLAGDPAPLEGWLPQLFLGGAQERSEAAAVLMASIVPRLERAAGTTLRER